MKRIAVRSYSRDYTNTTKYINNYLNEGYRVVMVTPFIRNGNTDYLEYILEEDKKEEKEDVKQSESCFEYNKRCY